MREQLCFEFHRRQFCENNDENYDNAELMVGDDNDYKMVISLGRQ